MPEYADAIARLAARKGEYPLRLEATPARSFTDYDPPRPISDWTVDGQVVEGHEASGKAFPFHVLDAPAEYVVTGEERYEDGRWYLQFGMRPVWIEANTEYRWFPESRYPIYVCPDCGGRDHDHMKVTIPNPNGMGLSTVKCPRDSKKAWGR